MADPALVEKLLGGILQVERSGVTASCLQSEYRELTGEAIPHRPLGHGSLSGLLDALPSVVRAERTEAGEVLYFTSRAWKKGNVAEVAARQRSSRRSGRPHLVNTQMRVKSAAPLAFSAKPQTSLRQPSHRGRGGGGGGGGRGGGRGGRTGHGDFRGARTGDPRDGPPDGRIAQHSTAHKRAHAPPGDKSEKRMTLPSRFHKEVQAHLSKNTPQTGYRGPTRVQSRLREILIKYSNGFWVSKLPQIYRELYKEELPTTALRELETWTHICTVEKTCSSSPSELLLYPAEEQRSSPVSSSNSPSPQQQSPSPSPPSSPASPASPATLSPDLLAKLNELLLKYSNGLWAHALPKLFQDTYKTKLPEHVLENLHLLSRICTIDYPMSDNPKRAILYRRSSSRAEAGPCQVKEAGWSVDVPLLQPPTDEYPSVLVVDTAHTNAVILRYIGEVYSQAQEAMEDEMRRFYSTNLSNPMSPAPSPHVGQLVAVRAEEEDEILRAKVAELLPDKVKVYYVDHGFTEVISKSNVFDLNEKFFKLPFQATECRLAGLEPFCEHPTVLKTLESMANGKILLAEIVQRGERPLVVLYDTSQDDDVNINAACARALQDLSLASPLQVNSVHMNVAVSSVCSDGSLYCQLPSRGLYKLRSLLDTIEMYFQSQVTSECLVSLPFCGKACLARYKGKWARVEITNLHGSRVLDILLVDMGVQASVEVFELREIPQPFLQELLTIPAQAVKCCLAELVVSLGSWTPEAVQWLRERVLHLTDCSIKVAKVDEAKGCVHVHLFTDKNVDDATHSINHQMVHSQLFKQHPDVILTSQSQNRMSGPSPKFPSPPEPTSGTAALSTPSAPSATSAPEMLRKVSAPKETPDSCPVLPPLIELPPPGKNLDVYVSLACHPGHFVLQPWRDMYKLVVLMGEMILFYNKTEPQQLGVSKGHIYAAKVDNNWYRVLVKSVLTNGLVSIYELDYGRHELVSGTQLRVLVQDFRRLPFQALTAQLAGLKQRQWSEEASIVFRNHVEKKALVAQLEVLHEAPESWERRLSVFLVDTSQEERDVWVHDIMAEFIDELSNEM
ncbi:tudor domain-containing protein 7B [Eucyclogobius newberryi]|uniref:tudor domain-containing protein 7B n=1 Tax=Eucyclogobius newberryi TaxID=166745 RepID=UPI003B58C3A6